jgi:hypothetical protein
MLKRIQENVLAVERFYNEFENSKSDLENDS